MIMIILGLMTVIVLMSKDQYNAYMLLIKKLFSNSGAFLDECRLTIIFFDKSYLHLFHPILWMMCFIETCKLLPDKLFE